MKNQYSSLFCLAALICLIQSAACHKKDAPDSKIPAPKPIVSSTNTVTGVTSHNPDKLSPQNDDKNGKGEACTFTHLDLNLCIAIDLPAKLYLGQAYPVSLDIKSMDRGDSVSIGKVLSAKVSMGGLEQEFEFDQDDATQSMSYKSQFIFDQVGEATVTLALMDDEDINLEGEVDITISKSSEGYESVKKDLPSSIAFAEQGIELSIDWLENIKSNGLISEELYKINIEANETFSEDYTLQWLAFMPEMEHKTLDFYIEPSEESTSQMQATLQMIMPGYWVFSVLLYKNGHYINGQLFSHQVKENI